MCYPPVSFLGNQQNLKFLIATENLDESIHVAKMAKQAVYLWQWKGERVRRTWRSPPPSLSEVRQHEMLGALNHLVLICDPGRRVHEHNWSGYSRCLADFKFCANSGMSPDTVSPDSQFLTEKSHPNDSLIGRLLILVSIQFDFDMLEMFAYI